MTPSAIFLSFEIILPTCSRSMPLIERAFDGEHVDVELVEIGQRGLVGLVLARHPLRRRAAPASVAPHLTLVAQAFDFDVERFDPLLRLDRLLRGRQ